MTIAIAGSGAAHTTWHGPTGPITSSAIDTTGAELLIVCLAQQIAGTTTISDSKGNSWSLISSKDAGFSRLQVWQAASPAIVGSGHTFTYNNNSSPFYARVQVTAYTGFAGTPTLDQSSTGSGGSSAQPGSVTPAVNNELLICASGSDGSSGATASIDSSFSIIDQSGLISSDSYGLAVAYLVQTSATAENPIYTWTSASASSAAIHTFKNVGGGTTFNQTVTASTTPNAAIVRKTGKTIAASSTPVATVTPQKSGSIVNHQTVAASTTPNATISTKLIPKPGSSTRAFFNASS